MLSIDPLPWGDATALIAYGDETGVRICVHAVTFRTSESICAPSELRDGTAFTLAGDEQRHRPPGRPLVAMPSSVIYLAARPQTSLANR